MPSFRIFSDAPISNSDADVLNFGPYAGALVDLACDVPITDLPFCIGLFGEWGSGKTSLMRLTRDKLHDRHIKTIWFNPWKYDRKEALWSALITELVFTMEADAPNAVRFYKANERVYHMLEAFVRGGLSAASTPVGLKPLTDELFKTGRDSFQQSNAKEMWTFVRQFEDAFNQLVRAYLGRRSDRLVVFIDDLDRCLPENAITVLESIKLFLDKSPCVFVVGADQAVIQYGLEKSYGATYATRDYLEKIIQVPIRMPRVVSQAVNSLWDEVKELPGYHDTAKELATQVLGLNLRQWKRFLNAYAMATAIAYRRGVRDSTARAVTRAFVVLVGIRFPHLYDELNKDPVIAERFVSLIGAGGEEYNYGPRLAQTGLQHFSRYVEDKAIVEFLKTCWGFLGNAPQLGGETVTATLLQEAFSCVPL